MKNKRLLTVFAVFAAAIVALILMASYFAGNTSQNTNKAAASNKAQPAAPASGESEGFFFFDVMGVDSTPTPEDSKTWQQRTVQIIFRLLLAVLLSGILAFRPRKDVPLFRRSLFVSQTQILLAVVAAALMMIVGDNAARAFAIFAAVSLVRFRTNIRDPKEVTVLLISLALGLAAGVGRWELGIALCLFALGLLWLLEFNESDQMVRSMELTVRTRDTEETQRVLKRIFSKMKLDAEMRGIDPQDEDKPIGSIVYYLNLKLKLSTDFLSDRILAADPENIEGIQWSKTKNANDIYQ
ncbi:MAG: MgtC/SapB family protein [Saprospiraceae bacterium]|nr:MgtC/SapB family protein [Pyrinomonadaceae bacterium]